MIECYSWATPNGRKIHIMLEETGLAYLMRPVRVNEGDQFTPEFLRVSPNNKIPAIIDNDGPDGKPMALFESGAILIYLASKSGMFLPNVETDPQGHYAVLQWLMFQMGSIGPMFGQVRHFRHYAMLKVERHRLAYGIERYTNECHRLYGVLEQRLSGNDYVAGAYSIADMAIFPWLLHPANQGVEIAEYPHVESWFDRIAERPAVQKGLDILTRQRVSEPQPTDAGVWDIMFGSEQNARR
jgi:GST-like protein